MCCLSGVIIYNSFHPLKNTTAAIFLKYSTYKYRMFQKKQEAQLLLTNRMMLVCKVVEVWQNFLSEYVNKKFTYICYRRLIRHE